MHAVWSCITHLPASDDHHNIRFRQRALLFLLIVFPDEVPDFNQMRGSFFNFEGAQFDFNKCISSVFEMQDCLSLKSI